MIAVDCGRKTVGKFRLHGPQDGLSHLTECKLMMSKSRLRKKPGGRGNNLPLLSTRVLQRDSPIFNLPLEMLLSEASTRRYSEAFWYPPGKVKPLPNNCLQNTNDISAYCRI
jgi:hypothetical protein